MANVFRSLFRRAFASWLTDNPPFYPSTLFTSSYVGSKEPILIDVDDLMQVYLTCGHLRAVIDKKATMFKNMEIKLFKKDGTEVESHPVLDLLNRPNPLQTQAQFLAQYSIYKDVFANAFIYKLKATSSGFPVCLYNLPPNIMEVVPTGKVFNQSKYEDIIKGFNMVYGDGKKEPMAVNDIIFITQGVSDDYITGQSSIKSLQLPISNLQGALKTRNVVIHEKGAIGMMSSEAKDGEGGIPLGKDERKRIEEHYRRQYGISDEQSKILVTSSAVKWTPITFPLGDLKVFEEVEEDFATMCGTYGMARELFPSVSNATFENQRMGEQRTYQSTMQPEADNLMEVMSKDLGLTAQGLMLEASYDWLPSMQADKEKEAKVKQIDIQTYSQMLADGIISPEAYAEMAGVELTGTGEAEGGSEKGSEVAADNLGKIPLAIQQLALARERAMTANDTQLAERLGSTIDQLINRL